jgi:drug/metabolite transporter (DMT)-like permease
VAWGGLDALRKRLAADVPAAALAALLALGQAPLFLAWVLASGGLSLEAGYTRPAAASAGVNLLASWMFMRALRLSPLSLTVPMLSFTPVFAAGWAAALLGEWPAPLQGAGIAGVVTGAALLLPRGGARALTAEPGVALMLGVALLWSGGVTFDKAAMAHAAPATHGLVQSLAVGLGLAAALALRGRAGELARVRRVGVLYLAACAASAAAVGLQLVALQALLVSLVEATKRAVGLSLAVINGAVFFREQIRPRQVLAVLMMISGTFLLLLGDRVG